MTRDEMMAKLQRVSDRLEYLAAADLRGELADVLAALSPRTCGTCRHYDGDHGTTDGVRYGFCTNRSAWHSGRSMPPFDGCTTWAARDEEDGA
jgi:hypothetical protein